MRHNPSFFPNLLRLVILSGARRSAKRMFFRSRRSPAKRVLPEPLQGIRPVPLSLLLFPSSLFPPSLFLTLLFTRRRGGAPSPHAFLHFRRLLTQLRSLERLPIKSDPRNPHRREVLPMSAQLFVLLLALVMENKNLGAAVLIDNLTR